MNVRHKRRTLGSAAIEQGEGMQTYTYWFALAFVLVAVEMLTGTFYFLALAAAAAVGGLLALAGLDVALQYALTGVLAVADLLLVRRLRKSWNARADLGLDVGQPVKVLAWRADGSARVQYRGAEWDAEPETAAVPHDATLYIKAVRGTRLIVTQDRPQ